MAIAETLRAYLDQKRIAYDLVAHPRTYSSHDSASAAHLPDDHLAKGVLLADDTGHVEVVVPASQWVKLNAVRLDTPSERGSVTIDLVKEVRARLDLAGFNHVKIFVSGGLSIERIKEFVDSGAPVDSFGIGSYITGARPIDFTADLHEIEGKPIAKRGRIPGITPNPRLKRVM